MSIEQNTRLAQELLSRMGSGAEPNEIASLFSEDLEYEIAGDVSAAPWIGKKKGRKAFAEFMRDLHAMVEPLKYEVHDIVANDRRAVILGELAAKARTTGKTVETAFAYVLTVVNGEITQFRMFEDSFAISMAARP